MDSFHEASEFLETFLRDAGLIRYVEGKHRDPTGELLFSMIWWYSRIAQLVSQTEPDIVRELGDRRERYKEGDIDCSGVTSHSCGLLVVRNMLVLKSGEPPFDIWSTGTWDELTDSQRKWFSKAELKLNKMAGPAAHVLAHGVRYERSFIAAVKKQPDQPWTAEQETKGRGILIQNRDIKANEFVKAMKPLRKQVSLDLRRKVLAELNRK